jgi:hypothetical protein
VKTGFTITGILGLHMAPSDAKGDSWELLAAGDVSKVISLLATGEKKSRMPRAELRADD